MTGTSGTTYLQIYSNAGLLNTTYLGDLTIFNANLTTSNAYHATFQYIIT